MLDTRLRPVLEPYLRAIATKCVQQRITADHMTLTGLGFGLAAAGMIAAGASFWLALLLFGLNRLADGLDGAIARLSTGSDRGGLLDIVCDFAVYGAVPLAFALRDPSAHAPAACVLLFTFYVNGASFLAYAAMAARRNLPAPEGAPKALYFTTGLAEGTETILFFVAMMLWPAAFPVLAMVFALVCLVTCLARIRLAWTVFAPETGRG